MPLVTATFTTGGNVVITDTVEVAAIEALTAQLVLINTAMGAVGGAVPGTVLGIMSASQGTLSNISSKITEIDNRLKELGTQVTDLNGQLEKSRTGLASISTHLGQQATIQKLSFLDNAKHIEFQQQTTNASLKDAGKPPTVVTPTAFVAKVESTLKDVTVINAQTTIISSVTEYASTTLLTAYEESLAWAAKTEVGGWIVTQWGKGKALLSGLFTAEKVKEVAADAKQAALDVKGGNPATLGGG